MHTPARCPHPQVLVDEKCAESAARLGPIFRKELEDMGSPLIQKVGVGR